MKRILYLIIALFALNQCNPSAKAQELIGDAQKFKTDNYYFLYTGDAADTLTTNQDTISFEVTLNRFWESKFEYAATLDTIGGADTTVRVNLYGKTWSGESYTKINTTISSAIGSESILKIHWIPERDTTAGGGAYRADSTQNFRYHKLEYILSGNDATGTGIILEKLEGSAVNIGY